MQGQSSCMWRAGSWFFSPAMHCKSCLANAVNQLSFSGPHLRDPWQKDFSFPANMPAAASQYLGLLGLGRLEALEQSDYEK